MRFLNTRIDNLSFDEALCRIDELIREGAGGYVVTPNVDHIVQLERNKQFQAAYKEARLILTDGKPLIWISKWLGCPIKEKISGADLLPRLCELASRRNYKMFFLGARPGIAEQAAANLTQRYPGLQVVGTYSPEYGFEKEERRVAEIWQTIHRAQPDILITALGTPKQEIFLWESREELKTGILAFGFGASLDFEAGSVKRAPRWMQNCGLEWLYRLSQEPGRLFRRYLINDTKILSIAWKYRKAGKNEDCS